MTKFKFAAISVPFDLLAKLTKLGRRQEAKAEFEKAAALAGSARERELLLQRAWAAKG